MNVREAIGIVLIFLGISLISYYGGYQDGKEMVFRQPSPECLECHNSEAAAKHP